MTGMPIGLSLWMRRGRLTGAIGASRWWSASFLAGIQGEVVVTPISSGKVVEDVSQQYGGRVEWTKVGSTVVSWRMIELGAKLGGEENGGIFYAPHLPVRDGTMAALLIAEIMAKTRRSLSQLLGELPKYYTVKSKIHCPNDLRDTLMREVESTVEASRLETLDGVKAWFEDGSWILIRPSGTEPIIRFFAEASTMKGAKALIDEYKGRVTKAVKRLGGS